ncbi:T9SS type A sorting domain-containing protein [Flavobacterium sp. GT3R68]|uniref:T9SS type A sorting domain-containing protein n=1 Tax=Flavobacterium sp. GT3R68 TaxID=2594437 RepID=UPI000F86358F|nr:T9SS type A sorting domain-containing protein [Flavobacterium sp. GT3R68]RTY95085.1 T9SS type A sorting domain-containing protein [Flavobacterium sp. GSN2]TRW91891.1 T9SS type A sorting domain-containing protein [Flavobacterium sp. GT3R68]
MKKITLLLLLIFTGWQVNAQSTCTQTFTVSGQDDGPTTLTINATDLNCYGAVVPTSIKLINPAGSLASSFCSTWYGFILTVDGGTPLDGCGAAFNNYNITGFNTLNIVSYDQPADNWSDSVTMTITVEVTFTPLTAPNCTALSTPANAANNVLSGVISWPAATGGATGYKLKVGTTPGGTNVLNLFDVGNVLTYDLGTLTAGTTYYVTVVPYNAIGNSTGCTESSFTTCGINVIPALENFTTYLPGCWQEADNGNLIAGPATFGSSSWAADGFANNGSTGAFKYNVYAATANDWVVSPLYAIPATGYELKFDAAAVQWNNTTAPTAPWESDDSIQVLISTGTSNWTVLYTYTDTNVPAVTGTTNIIDLDAYSGQNVRFAFRAIEGATNGTADIDFSIDNFQLRLTPSCAEPTALPTTNLTSSTANLSWTSTSGNYQYVLDTNIGNPAGVGTATTATTYNATLLSPSTSYYFHVRTDCGGLFSTWTTISFVTPANPPANDDCGTAISLTAGGVFDDNDVIVTNVGATDTAGLANPSCSSYLGGDVWFSVVVPASGTITIETSSNDGTITDTGLEVFTGNCAALASNDCDDDSGTGFFSMLPLTGLTPGQTLYLRIFSYDNDEIGTFKLSAYDASLGSNSFDNANFSYYPNPVKNMLNLSYSESISNVAVFNLLGQEVMRKTVNANQSQIDMTVLASGTYIVQVIADDQVKMIKVIKE